MRTITAVLATLAFAAPAAAAWEPEPATYGVGEQHNVPVPMADGTVLRADVYTPTNSDGSPAKGPFPVVMTQSPYGKDAGLGAIGQAGTGEFAYLVQRGYIDVVADVRGAGDSHGSWGLFDPIQAQDGAELVHWAAKLPALQRQGRPLRALLPRHRPAPDRANASAGTRR